MPIKPKALQKHSMRIAGHRTSLALEQEFWDALAAIARDYGTTIPVLIARIEAHYNKDDRDFSLASSCRVFALTKPQLIFDAPTSSK